MKALISPQELVYKYDGTQIGYRVAQVSESSFEIAPPLFWFDCADNVVADQWYYDTENQSVLPIPVAPGQQDPNWNKEEPQVI